MKDEDKKKEELIKELEEIRQRIAELNRSAIANKLAEEELLKSEERYRSLVELSPDMIALHNRGKFVYVNPAGIKMLGALRPDDLIGKSHLEFIHPEFIEIVQERVRELEQGKPVPLLEEKYIRHDGKIVYVEVAAASIPFQGEPMVQVIARDITERKRAEEALRKEKDKARKYLDVAGVILVVIEANQRVSLINRKGCEVLGFREEEIIGANWFDVFLPEWERDRVKDVFTRLMAGEVEPIEYFENRILTKTGEEKIIAWGNTLLRDEAGNTIGTLSSGEDITERQHAEIALRKREEEGHRLAHENAVLARIGRIISSTLSIEEVYKLFSEEVKQLLPFDRIAISLINKAGNTIFNRYVEGVSIVTRNQGDIFPIAGTFNEAVVQSRKGIVITEKNEEAVLSRYPGLLPVIQAGIRSFLSVPLISRDQVIGVIHFRSKKEKAYTEQDLKLAESIANQIAGAIASASLYSELKEAKEALQKKEEEFRELYDHAPMGYHQYDKDGKITRVNKTDLEMLGYGAEEMVGQPIWKFSVEEVAKDQVLAKLAGRLPPGKNLVRNYRRKDGSTFPVLIEDRLLKDERGEIAGIRCTIQDISERRRAEEALQKSEEEARRLAQESALVAEIGRIIGSTLNVDEVFERFTRAVAKLIPFDRIVINLPNLSQNASFIRYVAGIDVPNRRVGEYVSLVGSATEECMRTKSSLLIQPDEINEMASRFPTLLPTFEAGIRSIIMVPLISEGEIIGVLSLRSIKAKAYTEQDVRLAESISSQIAGAVANARLFYELQQTEETLRKSEEKYRHLVQNANDAIFIAQDGVIKFANLKTEELIGYPAAELAVLPFVNHVHPGDRDMVLGKHRKRLEEREAPGIYSFRVKNRSGDELWVELNSVQITWEERPATLNFLRNITEQKKLETQFLQAQKMEAIGRLAGGIAHDFNNFLTIINTNAQLALMELRDWDPLKEKLDSIQKAGKGAANLTRQLLSFTRRQVVEMKVIDLNALLQELGKMLVRVIGEDVALTTVLDKGLARTKVDPGQIEQVILNLVVNAKDAMPSGGKLTIETANKELDKEYAHSHLDMKPGRYVMLSVSDTGVGMTPEIRERIFEPFFTTKEKGKGTGLGLSTVYGVVKQTGGYIWVYSEPGQGTTFKIYLPRVDEPLEEEIKKRVGKGGLSGGSETILVVEDEGEVRKLAVAILRKQGYKILEASHGGDAFLICEQGKEPVHLLLTDVVMPGLNGPELARRLMYFYPQMKVLFMSGYTDNAISQQGVLDHGVAFLQKPFSVEGLVGKVREVLDR